MKRFLTLIVVLLATATIAHAQFGIVGGFTLSNTSVKNWEAASTKNMSQFHAGIAYKIKLGPLFALQPQLTYEAKGATVQEIASGGGSQTVLTSLKTNGGFVELGVGAQLGIDLLAFRPFILAQPFVGYQVYGKENLEALSVSSDDLNAYMAAAKNKLEWGFGVGGGVELLNHLQLSIQWFMNIGQMYNSDKLDADALMSVVVSNYKKLQNYQGVKFTLGVFF